MGLDWNPIGKPKPGHEAEFARLFKWLGEHPEDAGFLARLKLKWRGIDRARELERWFELQISPFETLNAPRVGSDPEADAWAVERYRQLENPTQTETEFLHELKGFHVVRLVPPCDGVPVYCNGDFGYVDHHSFRAQFLHDCVDIIGEDCFEKCFDSCLAPGLAALSAELRTHVTRYAAEHGVAHVEHVRMPEFEAGSPAAKAHIVFSAAKWGEFWSSRGHGLEAYW